MRIAFIISSLGCGGAERILVNMANYWAQKGNHITIITLESSDAVPFYYLESSVNYAKLDKVGTSFTIMSAVKSNFSRLFSIRKKVKEADPDIVVSFIDIMNIQCIIALLGTGIPIIISERVNPKEHNIGFIWNQLRSITYPLADRIVIQTKDIAGHFSMAIRKKCIVISNSIKKNKCSKSYVVNTTVMRIIAIGRLNYQKGFDILIKAFSFVLKAYDCDLYIFGEGAERRELTNLVAKLQLDKKVHLAGVTQSPHDELMKSDIFVMSSRYEGFPNALCEAMACGLPAISTDCPSGPNEIIINGYNGILVPVEDPEALAKAIIELIENEEKRNLLASNARDIANTFSEEKIMAKWETVIKEVCHENCIFY